MKKFIIYILVLIEETSYLAALLVLLSIGVVGIGTWLIKTLVLKPPIKDAASLLTASLMFIIWGFIGLLFIKRKEAPIFIIYPTGNSAVLTGFLFALLSCWFLFWIWIRNWKVILTIIELIKKG